jgi:hypothetical protein
VECDLIKSGFVPKIEKSLWKPTWMYIPVHVYYLHDLQKKQLSLHKSCMCCQACSYLIYSTYNLVNSLMYILYIKLPESSVQQLIVCKEFIWDVNVKHCSTDESCQSIVYSDASDISFGSYR